MFIVNTFKKKKKNVYTQSNILKIVDKKEITLKIQ